MPTHPMSGETNSNMSQDELSRLIARTALGDRAAFSLLYSQTSAKLFGVALRILKDRAQAEDAIQEVYVRIWRRAGSFRAGQASATAWLVTIARNQAIDLIRARQPATLEYEDAPDVADSAPDPEARAALSGEGRRIEACLGELETDKATAVTAAYVEGLSYQELAEQYGVPLNTMRTWLRRSLIKLRECMTR
jgi:RNA polymerase sigma-70 factor (ECF subfamily)